jgi:hypothetical protein
MISMDGAGLFHGDAGVETERGISLRSVSPRRVGFWTWLGGARNV